ncbi:MAG: lysophospholipid acyltransferase family protein [Mobilicoccus sp.]|nr:lysophospholipid acyltransferase family protein [Mobilicoccus sp.]
METPKVLEPGIDQTFVYRAAARTVATPMRALTATDRHGLEHLPPAGEGCVIAVNHISYIDPFAVAHLLLDSGRSPFFLAKESLFSLPLLGRWLGATGQVPVHRGTGRAVGAYTTAIAAVRAGRTVVVMPESTITRDPDLWPMKAKTGVVRIALATGCPLVPLGQWGAQDLMPRGSRRLRPFPRKTMRMRFSEPVDLGDLAVDTIDRSDLTAATTRVMDAITQNVAHLRSEPAPAGRWDPERGERVVAPEEERR